MLADPLGIHPEAGEKAARGAPATYREKLQEFARKDLKFLALVETAFVVLFVIRFVTSDRKVQILPRINGVLCRENDTFFQSFQSGD